MEIIKIVTFAFISLFIVMIFENRRNDLAVYVSMAVGILIFLFMITKITSILQFIQELSAKSNIDFVYLITVFKILGIAYLASFCSEICKDAGQGNIGTKVEFAGKILILALAIPILMAVLQSILKIM
ncbi:stage III sporulation protein AD [Clostridium sp. JS66]|uniref:stage III sporulation protein AD n=1 Tax=Clostridium sp. JS66 TaxID=3064705 RepID=UPI00298E5F22|nr:stage III sporulation protein AD [Clostridium sp. JS66]WPC40918.1 stage III sporulation protein AD [Clostridium sp. JS66]